MSTGFSTHESFVLVWRSPFGRGLDATTYASHLDIVKQITESGNLGNGSWASAEHLEALYAVLNHVKKQMELVRKEQRKERRRERYAQKSK